MKLLVEKRVRSVFALLASTFMVVTAHAQTVDNSTEQTKSANETSIRFVDSAGKQLKEVEALWFSELKTEVLKSVDGRHAPPSTQGIIVARKKGYQYSGSVLQESKPVDGVYSLTMLRDSEPPAKLKSTLPVPFDENARQRTRAEVEKFFSKMLGDDPRKFSLCIAPLMRLNPEATFRYLEEHKDIFGPDHQKSALRYAAIAAFENDASTTIELIDSMDNPGSRVYTIATLLPRIPWDDDNRVVLEKQMIKSLKLVKNANSRHLRWAQLAEYYSKSGQHEKEQKIIDNNINAVRKLPADNGISGFIKGQYASLVVSKNANLAEELINDLPSGPYQTAMEKVALRCCQDNPEYALQMLKQHKASPVAYTVYESQIRVASRMAVKQTEFAYEVADMIYDPCQKVWALALMADRLHQGGKSKLALEALDAAIEAAENDPEDIRMNPTLQPSVALASSLPMAEKIAPERLDTMIWKSIYLQLNSRISIVAEDPDHIDPEGRDGLAKAKQASSLGAVATAVSRYDRKLGRVLMKGNSTQGFDVSRALVTAAAFDIEQLPKALDQLNPAFYGYVYLYPEQLLDMLSGNPEDYWRVVSTPAFFPGANENLDN